MAGLAHEKLSSKAPLLLDRDLSWLEFNDRVLAQAQDASNPLLERARFLAITSSNLDEFFMIRYGSATKLGMIRKQVDEMIRKQSNVLLAITTALKKHQILIATNPKLTPKERPIAQKLFENAVLPHLLKPETISKESLAKLDNRSLAMFLPGKLWIPIPKDLPRAYLHFSETGGPHYGFFLDHLLAAFLPETMGLPQDATLTRITRYGDITVDLEDEDTESIPEVIRDGIRKRDRGKVMRLQYLGRTAGSNLNRLLSVLKISSSQVSPAARTLSLHGLWTLVNELQSKLGETQPQLFFPAYKSSIPQVITGSPDLFDQISKKDIFLHHPYDSFDGFVKWIESAAQDPHVISIEQTVYRMDALSPVIDALKHAAKSKKVRVLIELRARFDELNNLMLADELRKAGVEVHFGFGKLKIHAKIALVTRKEGGTHKHYTHLSTGNYNSKTARQYTDMAILTSDPGIGVDAQLFFESVSQGEVPSGFKKLVSAPTRLHRRVLNHIEDEIQAAKSGKPARIFAKVNALVDKEVIQKLYDASQAGVRVDLIVRGACSLVPGIPGLSDKIRVISIVDRYLEHSRIYHFANADVLYLSSADWMPRNFFSRLEIAFPVTNPDIKRFLTEVVIPIYLADNVKARILNNQGIWRKIDSKSDPIRSQVFFQELARNQYAGTPLNPTPQT